MDIIVMAIFSYALYRMAVGHNISPWKWIIRYVLIIIGSYFAIGIVLSGFIISNNVNPQSLLTDKAFIQKANEIGLKMLPFELLFEFGVFYLIRLRIAKYVQNLDDIDRLENTPPPPPPSAPKKEDQDFSYFR